MVVSSTLAMTVNVMTRAPPLFPFPLEEIRILTLRRPLPKSVPRVGLARSSSYKASKSFQRER